MSETIVIAFSSAQSVQRSDEFHICPEGKAHVLKFLENASRLLSNKKGLVFSSPETAAIETAGLIGKKLGVDNQVMKIALDSDQFAYEALNHILANNECRKANIIFLVGNGDFVKSFTELFASEIHGTVRNICPIGEGCAWKMSMTSPEIKPLSGHDFM